MLLFATPQLCQSRVCGPVVDVVAQVQAKIGGDVDFIHMEIYNDNQLDKGFRPQVGGLPPADRAVGVRRSTATGAIAERFEGAFSVGELERAVAKVTGR